MFGNTPRQLWAEWIKPDQDNLVDLASRGLLVQQGGFRFTRNSQVGFKAASLCC